MINLRLRSVFTPLDLSQVQSRRHFVPKNTLFEAETEEWLEPRVPLELMHIDMDEYLINYDHLYSMEALNHVTTEGTSLTITVGSCPLWINYPVRPETPICFDCRRPLHLYHVSRKSVDFVNRGYCPEHMWLRGTVVEYRQVFSDHKKAGTKPPTEEQYVSQQRKNTIAKWNKEDYQWWLNEKAGSTEKYQSWLTRQRNSQLSASTTESSPA
jgi:hypothetical protein